ncbi:MAG: SAM-dependent chlorinase/fluorinase [Chloroflexi bacterium]|nr:SAM-dependent chlorinase/fluorinase [Chloroflexota bacterium]
MGVIITLTTDFGLNDAYVAAMKGVILGINPEATLVDICHTIKPQNILEAAFILSTAYPFFPDKTIHVVVVDPGVGTERRAVLLKTPTACFLAPDNGVLSYVLADYSASSKELPPALQAVAITKPEFWRSPISSTFHGRDIFAPVAAHLSLGLSATKFGEVITSLTTLPLAKPYREADGSLVGHIIHIDSFGNLSTNIRSPDLAKTGKEITIEVGNRVIRGLSRTYAEGEQLLALIGSSDYLEVSLKEGSAHASLKVNVGDKVKIRTG